MRQPEPERFWQQVLRPVPMVLAWLRLFSEQLFSLAWQLARQQQVQQPGLEQRLA
jgi:hypothetical protein